MKQHFDWERMILFTLGDDGRAELMKSEAHF